MMFIEFLHAHYDILGRLAMTIVHSLWQGALIFAVLQIVLSQWKNTDASLRCSLFNLSIIALLSFSILTFLFLGSDVRVFRAGTLTHPSTVSWVGEYGLFPTLYSSGSVDDLMQWGIYLSAFWIIGAFIFLVKLLIDFYWAISLRRKGLIPVRTDVVHLCGQLRDKIGLSKNVRIFESLQVDVPLVIGHIKPYVLLPVGAMVQLSPLELEAVILHELSHIKRNDFIANILLMITEVVLFYHPVFWWLKKRIHEERENSCDDIVISHVATQNYAKALLKMEESRHEIRWAMALKDDDKFHLLKRVKRIYMKSNHEFKIDVGRVVVALLLVGAFAVITWADNKLSGESLLFEDLPPVEMIDESNESSASMPASLENVAQETIEDLQEPDISINASTDTVPPSMPKISDYLHAEISEELQRELQKYQEEMKKWQEELLSENEQMLQQQKLAMVQEMELQKSMQEMQKLQQELVEQEFFQKQVQEEALRQTMEELKEMETKLAEEALEKAEQQQQMMQEEMLKLRESLHKAEEIRAKELKTKMKSIEDIHKVKEKEMKAKTELLKAREKELRKLGEAERLRMESIHKEILEVLSKEGYTGDFQNMDWRMDGELLRLNEETLNRDLTEKCLEILKKYNFKLEGARWQIKKEK